LPFKHTCPHTDNLNADSNLKMDSVMTLNILEMNAISCTYGLQAFARKKIKDIGGGIFLEK
jgi:hypothetical protein